MAVELSSAACSQTVDGSDLSSNDAAERPRKSAAAQTRIISRVRLYDFGARDGEDWTMAINIARWMKREGRAV